MDERRIGWVEAARIHPASGLSVEDRTRVADALEARWGVRQEWRLREVCILSLSQPSPKAHLSDTGSQSCLRKDIRPYWESRRLTQVFPLLRYDPAVSSPTAGVADRAVPVRLT